MIEDFLSRLSKVRKTGQSRWVACCPAHEDRHPSLTVSETNDGVILVKCFAGCGIDDITGSVGIDMSDLFPPKQDGVHSVKGRRLPAADAARIMYAASLEMFVSVCRAVDGAELTEDDRNRMWVAMDRIKAAADEAGIS